MDSTAEPPDSGQTLSCALARSRSRYKRARQDKPVTSPEKLPNLPVDRIQRLREEPTARTKRGNPVDVQSLERAPQQRREHMSGIGAQAKSPEYALPPIDRRNYWEDSPDKRDGAKAEPVDKLKNAELCSKPAIEPEKESREQQTKVLRKRLERQSPNDGPSSLPTRSLTQRIAGQRKGHWRAQSKEELKRTISAPIANEPPETTITPAFDAPISAVNAGDRRVMVKYGQSVISLPVTPSTTPMDIIRSAGEQLSNPIKPKATVLLESFRQLGLERPLRRYEHVRDVLNSWDNDSSNTLVIIPSPTGGKDHDLEISSVFSSQPGDTSVHIYYSQKPGHWDKRWVTLRSDGQVMIAKREDGETSNICHLSDFDIYLPTARQIAKKIRPPRKVCFCVKSQQKSSMFMSATNFVHFFCTNDRDLATAWYKAVQEWRSWYLVNVMGERENVPGTPKVPLHVGDQGSSDAVARTQASDGISCKQPISAVELARTPPPQRLPTRSRGAPSVTFPKKLTKEADTGEATTRKRKPSIVQTSASDTKPEPFNADGLLGRTYTQRQKAQRERNEADPDLPPTVAVDEQKANGLRRMLTERPKTKPLIDLTPQYHEPPQHAKKGRGVMPEHIPPGGLAELATTPAVAIAVPSATTWQRPRTSSGGNVDAIANIHRTRTMSRDGVASSETREISASPEKSSPAFTGGLLANNDHSQGGTGRGRGIMTGDRTAKAPMLDVGEESQYAPGSLLERVERKERGPVRLVEREKRREVSVGCGEGV